MERTSVIDGNNSILIVAPHGGDEERVAAAAETLALGLGAFAVINRGWRVSFKVDSISDMANCNNVRHLKEDVVREEFLNPILRIVARIKKKHGGRVLMLVIKQFGDHVRDKAQGDILDIIIGHGSGAPPRHSCRARTKDALIQCLEQEGFGVYEGDVGSLHSGAAKNNLNQLFKRWTRDKAVESMQIEIAKELIQDDEITNMTMEGIIAAVDAMFAIDEDQEVEPKQVGKI
jgi:hypothetical protein